MSDSFAAKLEIAEHDFRLVFGRTRIDYDPNKDDANRKNHGYALESAMHLLTACLGPIFTNRRIITSDGFIERGEVRHMHLAEDSDGMVLMIVTTIRPDEVVRLISVRRARRDERARFYEMTNKKPH